MKDFVDTNVILEYSSEVMTCCNESQMDVNKNEILTLMMS